MYCKHALPVLLARLELSTSSLVSTHYVYSLTLTQNCYYKLAIVYISVHWAEQCAEETPAILEVSKQRHFEGQALFCLVDLRLTENTPCSTYIFFFFHLFFLIPLSLFVFLILALFFFQSQIISEQSPRTGWAQGLTWEPLKLPNLPPPNK